MAVLLTRTAVVPIWLIGASASGNGLLQFTVAPNNGPARTGIISIAGQSYSVRQGSQ